MKKLRLRNHGSAKLPHLEEVETGFRPDRFDSKGQILSTASFNTFLRHLVTWVLPGRGSGLLEVKGGRMAEQTMQRILLQRPNPEPFGRQGKRKGSAQGLETGQDVIVINLSPKLPACDSTPVPYSISGCAQFH